MCDKKIIRLFFAVLLISITCRLTAQDSSRVQPQVVKDTVFRGLNRPPTELLPYLPAITLPALLDAKVAGVTTLRKSSEPGIPAWLLVRGLHAPVSRQSDIYSIAPLYVVDGIPLIQNHAFPFGIKQYDYERVGSETDITAMLNINDIESIEVLKDPADIASYGVQGIDGVVLIHSRKPSPGKYRVHVNLYGGVLLRPDNIKTANGRYERDFRKPFYDAYATPQQQAAFRPI